MSLLTEYIQKVKSGLNLQDELVLLIKKYNEYTKRYLLVYVASTNKNIPGVELEQGDYYTIHDLLRNVDNVTGIDFYIETRGGSGETAEEIVKFLRNKYQSVNFIVAGEAKSAGTILVLSGNDIWMAETGSLGPIDAQMQIGRSWMSAHDYKEWVEEKHKEASDNNYLNPFDQIIIAQITPGELRGVLIALDYAKDLVKRWLINYKFAAWNETEIRKIKVDQNMKENAAQKVVDELVNHSKWYSHGRSIKISDLEEIGLKIKRIDDDKKLAEIVYRIQIICRLMLDSTSTYKIFSTQESKIFKNAVKQNPFPLPIPMQGGELNAVEIELQCNNCKKINKLYFKLAKINTLQQKQLEGRGFKEIKPDLKIKCSCGTILNLENVKNDVEKQSGRKVIFD